MACNVLPIPGARCRKGRAQEALPRHQCRTGCPARLRSKTTLLNLLSRRTAATSGEILFNGKKPTYQLQRVQGFVEQEGEGRC